MSKNLTAILKILLYTGIFSTTLPLVFFIFYKLHKKQRALRVILFYILYCILNEAIGYYLQEIRSEKFVILIYTFTIIEFLFFCYFIYLILPKNFVKKIIPYICILFVTTALVDILYLNNKHHEFDSFASGIGSIIIIMFCIYYLFYQIKGSNSLLIYSTFNFWVVISFLIFFSCTFFLYLFTNSMTFNSSFQKIYLIINISFNILKNILLSVAMTMRLNDSVNQQKTAIPDLDNLISIHAKN